MVTRLVPVGSQFEINVNNGGGNGILGFQSLPQAATLTDGRFAVVYQSDFSGDATNVDPIATILSSISYLDVSPQARFQFEPALAARLDGGFGVVFASENHADGTADPLGPNIIYVPVSSTGVLGTPLAIADFGDAAGHNAVTSPRITTLSSGRQLVVYDRTWDANDSDSVNQVVNAAGTATVFSTSSAPHSAGWDAHGSVAANSNQALIVWESGASQNTPNIFARVFDDASTTFGSPFLIADHSAGLFFPEVAALSDGRYVILYTDLVDVWGRIYDPATPGGSFLSAEFQINQIRTGDSVPACYATADGGFIATWAGSDVHARRFDARGLPFGDEFLVNTLTNSTQGDVTVTVSGSNVLFAWTDFASRPGDTTPTSVQARMFTTTVFDYDSARYADFDNDGRSDVLFQNDTGNIAIWKTDSAGAVSNIVSVGQLPAGFRIDGTGNFNSAPGDDILLRSPNQVAVLPMAGTTAEPMQVLGGTSPTWLNSGIGEFTGDGQSDLLFRHVGTGEIATWGVSDNALTTAPQVLGSAPAEYHIVAVDDFTGDHQADILFRHDNGAIAIWRVANNGLAGVPAVVGTTSSSYHVVTTGDFDGNGANDILFRNDNGDLAMWLLNSAGELLGAPAAIGTIGAQYHVDGTGDLNGDGRSDIIFRHADGTLVAWLMNGTSLAAPPTTLGTIAVDYAIAAHHFDVV